MSLSPQQCGQDIQTSRSGEPSRVPPDVSALVPWTDPVPWRQLDNSTLCARGVFKPAPVLDIHTPPLPAALLHYRAVGVGAQSHLYLFGAAVNLEAGRSPASPGRPVSALIARVARFEVGHGPIDELVESSEMVPAEVSCARESEGVSAAQGHEDSWKDKNSGDQDAPAESFDSSCQVSLRPRKPGHHQSSFPPGSPRPPLGSFRTSGSQGHFQGGSPDLRQGRNSPENQPKLSQNSAETQP